MILCLRFIPYLTAHVQQAQIWHRGIPLDAMLIVTKGGCPWREGYLTHCEFTHASLTQMLGDDVSVCQHSSR